MKGILQRHRWLRFAVTVVLIIIMLPLSQIITVQGEAGNPKFVMLRLEDIGPGGQYDSLENVGKLRTVLEYLSEHGVVYHLAVVPKWIHFTEQGQRMERSLDQLSDPYIRSFNKLLAQAVQSGASLGLHGDTHQAGDTVRQDGHHETGIGNEFYVPDLAETSTPEFADRRIKEGLGIMASAGLQPRFWEAPHYRTTAAQDKVFRSYFGMNYQADMQAGPQPEVRYITQQNKGFGAPSSGAVYVPTPFSYIAYNKDEKAIFKLIDNKKNKNLPSFFFHPFLEFKHLVPVLDGQGEPVMRDGLPEYRYEGSNHSVLQKLISGLKEREYKFYTIHDYVPFTPAHTVQVAADKDFKLLAGDVTGNGQADLVVWDAASGSIRVTEGHFKGPRNETQPAPSVWASVPYKQGCAFALADLNGDGRADLLIGTAEGAINIYLSDKGKFVFYRSVKVSQSGWSDLFAVRKPGGTWLIAGQSLDQTQLQGALIGMEQASAVRPYRFKSAGTRSIQPRQTDDPERQTLFVSQKGRSSGIEMDYEDSSQKWTVKKVSLPIPIEDGDLILGDFNGDGREDAFRWDPVELKGKIYCRNEYGEYNLLSRFGPWDSPGGALITADFDGNGEMDIAAVHVQEKTVNIALSFQSRKQP